MNCNKHLEEVLRPVGKLQRLKCKACEREYQSKWWKNNKATQLQRVKANRERAIQLARDYLFQYLKTHPCVVCGETDLDMLEFDHIDQKDKRNEISQLVVNGCCLDTIKQEMAKCQVLCANHHRKKTRQQLGWFCYAL
jgi:hypothetical protein